jgi:hypothetical protein
VTLKDAVYEVIPESYAVATGDGVLPVSARTFYYQVRPRIQIHTDRELEFEYFSQQLLVEYRRTVDPLLLIYYEPRGELHDPHDRDTVQLGTLEVEAYIPPDWNYDKVLYVEKTGLWPTIQAARIAERYDMAILTGEGFAVTAARAFLDGVGAMRLFALHDADPAGYNISRTLGEPTWRMPDHQADIIDLGLTVPDAIARGLQTESFTRSKALPKVLLPRLDLEALEWFTGVPFIDKNSREKHRCTRVELNAFSGPELVAYIEDRLAANGADQKLVPPQAVLDSAAEDRARRRCLEALETRLASLVDLDALADELYDATRSDLDPLPTEADVSTYFRDHPHSRRHRWNVIVSVLLRNVPDLDERAATLLDGALRRR